MKTTLPLLCLCLAGACAPSSVDELDADRAAIAVMADLGAGVPLEEMLLLLDEQLALALAGRLDANAEAAFLRAEAISDRLLQARMPFAWIPTEEYSLSSRLRQIQSSSDRVMALLQTGAPRDTMLLELQTLRTEVVELRRTVAQGGTAAPPSIEVLLRGDTTSQPPVPAGTAAAAAGTEPRLLGTPVRQQDPGG